VEALPDKEPVNVEAETVPVPTVIL